MTLVCNTAVPMPSDYSNSGVDILYPHEMMNPHQFSDADWSAHSPLVRSSYDSKPQHIFMNSQDTMPSTLADYSQTYSAPHRPPPIQVNSMPNNLMQMSRPKSSPSTFPPNVEDLLFTENPFRLKTEEFPPPIFTLSPQSQGPPHNKLTSPFYPTSDYATSNPSQSPNRSRPIPIAPDPIGLSNINALKRAREDEEISEYGPKKRKRALSGASQGPVELNDEEQLLLKLKEEENLPWKDIAVRFQTDLGKSYQVPALQMRFKRLRERMRTWTETDVQALEQAYDYWEKFQFDIIAAKMLDFGASERWPAKYCARKWEELHPGRAPYSAHSNYLRDPWETAVTASPVGSTHSGFGHLSPRATM